MLWIKQDYLSCTAPKVANSTWYLKLFSFCQIKKQKDIEETTFFGMLAHKFSLHIYYFFVLISHFNICNVGISSRSDTPEMRKLEKGSGFKLRPNSKYGSNITGCQGLLF